MTTGSWPAHSSPADPGLAGARPIRSARSRGDSIDCVTAAWLSDPTTVAPLPGAGGLAGARQLPGPFCTSCCPAVYTSGNRSITTAQAPAAEPAPLTLAADACGTDACLAVTVVDTPPDALTGPAIWRTHSATGGSNNARRRRTRPAVRARPRRRGAAPTWRAALLPWCSVETVPSNGGITPLSTGPRGPLTTGRPQARPRTCGPGIRRGAAPTPPPGASPRSAD